MTRSDCLLGDRCLQSPQQVSGTAPCLLSNGSRPMTVKLTPIECCVFILDDHLFETAESSTRDSGHRDQRCPGSRQRTRYISWNKNKVRSVIVTP